MGEQEEYEERLRGRLRILKQQIEAGKVHFSQDTHVIESLKAMRYGPDGEIDLSTVDGSVRAMALAVSHFHHRSETKDFVSLADVQQTYFEFIEKNFGSLYARMKRTGATPDQVASALADDPKTRQEFAKGIAPFTDRLEDFWETALLPVHYHIEDLRGLKAVFGGETFPTGTKNIVSAAGLYTDTIVLPDPLLRVRRLHFAEGSVEQIQWFLQSALALLHYREAALANVDVPLVAIVPDRLHFEDEEQEALRRISLPSILAHIKAMFGVELSSLEEIGQYFRGMVTPTDVLSRLCDKERLLFDVDNSEPLEKQIVSYAENYLEQFETCAGQAVMMNAVGRMMQATDLLRRSQSLRGAPLIDAPTVWRYYNWWLGYQSDQAPAGSQRLHLHMTRGLQSATSEFEWLGNVPVNALVEMRKANALPELRAMFSAGVEELMQLRPTNFHRTGDQIVENIQKAFDEHQRKLRSLTGRKWRFAGVELASCIVKGAVQVASACGVPGVSLVGAALDQITDVPKIKDIPKKYRAIRDESEALHSSAVGMLFSISTK